MNIALWIVQGLLALMFISAGLTKAFQYNKAKAKLPWVKDSSKGLVTFIGLSELLGGLVQTSGTFEAYENPVTKRIMKLIYKTIGANR